MERLGVSEEFIGLVKRFDSTSKDRVLTAYGLSSGFVSKRGWNQGGEESPTCWVLTYDPLLQWMEDTR